MSDDKSGATADSGEALRPIRQKPAPDSSGPAGKPAGRVETSSGDQGAAIDLDSVRERAS